MDSIIFKYFENSFDSISEIKKYRYNNGFYMNVNCIDKTKQYIVIDVFDKKFLLEKNKESVKLIKELSDDKLYSFNNQYIVNNEQHHISINNINGTNYDTYSKNFHYDISRKMWYIEWVNEKFIRYKKYMKTCCRSNCNECKINSFTCSMFKIFFINDVFEDKIILTNLVHTYVFKINKDSEYLNENDIIYSVIFDSPFNYIKILPYNNLLIIITNISNFTITGCYLYNLDTNYSNMIAKINPVLNFDRTYLKQLEYHPLEIGCEQDKEFVNDKIFSIKEMKWITIDLEKDEKFCLI